MIGAKFLSSYVNCRRCFFFLVWEQIFYLEVLQYSFKLADIDYRLLAYIVES